MEPHTTTEEFYETIEEPAPINEDRLADAVGAILDHCFVRRTGGELSPQNMAGVFESSMRSFVALVYLVRPSLLPGDGSLPAWQYAEALGCTRQAFSRLCVQWSDKLGGLRRGEMKTPDAREAYRRSNGYHGDGIKRRAPDHIGERSDDATHKVEEGILANAMRRFAAGRPWTKKQREVLSAWGMIDDADQLTKKGREAVLTVKGVAAAPRKESP